MRPMVTTTAFDSVVAAEPELTIWTARGFVSPGQCGFGLFASSAQPRVFLEWPTTGKWWDHEVWEADYPMVLLADGTPVELASVGGGPHGAEGGVGRRFVLYVTFPTPASCVSLRLSAPADLGAARREVALDPVALRESLARCERLYGSMADPAGGVS